LTTTGFIQKSGEEVRSQPMMKERNLKRLFDLIVLKKEISRAQLATKTTLSPTTVSTLIDEMIKNGLVVTSGIEQSTRIGRKGILLKINSERLRIPTIAWERKGFRFILYDFLCNELESFYFPISEDSNYVELLHNLILEKLKKFDQETLGPLCITIPAIIDTKTHKIISTVLDVKGQEDFLVDIRKIFVTRPIIIGNESNFYAYAEKEFVLKRNVQNLIYINVNVGVGAGIIYKGKIFRGSFGMSGEFGHTSVDMNGPLCSCGNRGCLERLISTPRIIERAITSVKSANTTKLLELCSGNLEHVNIEQVAEAFIQKDKGVITAMEETAIILAFGINNILRIFDPEIVVIGGGIEIFGDDFLALVKEAVAQNGSNIFSSGVQIIYTKLSPTCKNRGVAKYYIDNIMSITKQHKQEVIIC